MDNVSHIVIMYATVTGNTQQYAEAVTAALSGPGSGESEHHCLRVGQLLQQVTLAGMLVLLLPSL